MQSVDKSHTLAIPGWMISCSVRLLHLIDTTQLLHQTRLKITALVGMHVTRHPQLIKPLHHWYLSYCLSMLVPSGNSHCVFSEDISHHLNILYSCPGCLQ